MSLLERLTAFIAPDECLTCGREGQLLCPACLSQLPSLHGRCFGCYAPVSASACMSCLQAVDCNSLMAATAYEGVAKRIVASLKFNGNQSAAKLMAQCMIPRCPAVTSSTIVTHVPATTAHIRERGFDQAELIASQLARQLDVPRASLLRRLGTTHQLGANRQARHEQLLHAVTARKPERMRGAHIILIDDVLTTGASLRASAAALRRAGAARVDALVFAQALKGSAPPVN